jgi:hypothetical protein
LELGVSESRLTDVYVALRNLLRAKFVSPDTKEQAARAIQELQKEAFVDAVLETDVKEPAIRRDKAA